MRKLRKVNTTKRKKERKEAKERMVQQAALMLNHPQECCVCAAPFERSKETVKSWQVTIAEECVRLSCPSCWALVNEIVERRQNED